mgnify:FL=1
MFGQIFNNNSIRNYVIYFGKLFSDLILIRDDEDGNEIQRMKVPLNYGPKEKYLNRAEGNPDLEREIAIALPRMSFEITDMRYDPTRKLNSTGRLTSVNSTDPNKKDYFYNPVPYNIMFNLYIMTKNIEDGTRIVEQILPYFTPEFTGNIIINNDTNNKQDVPLTLNTVTPYDSYEGSYLDRRAIIWVLSFELKAYLFGPSRSAAIIKQVELNFYDAKGTHLCDPQAEYDKVTITPGLTSTGLPTDSHSNSIDKNLINSDDNYGFITDYISSKDI